MGYMWELKANYSGKGLEYRCPRCSSEEEYYRTCLIMLKKGDKKFNFNDKRGKECGKIVEIYRNNKENRSVDNIGEEQKLLEE